MVDSVFPLEQGREAFERLASGNQLGKVVVSIANHTGHQEHVVTASRR